jgi:hypothetical protein
MRGLALSKRLISPTGLLAVAACFLLPFVTVSCSSGPAVAATATYRGVDLVVGARAQLSVSDELRQDAGQAPSIDGAPVPTLDQVRVQYTKPIPVQPFMVLVLVLLGLGGVSAVVRTPWPRALAESGFALGALLFLAGGEVLARRAATARVSTDVAPFVGPTGVPSQPRPAATIHTQTGVGFWLAASLLLLVAALTLIRLARLSTTSAAVPATPDHHEGSRKDVLSNE